MIPVSCKPKIIKTVPQIIEIISLYSSRYCLIRFTDTANKAKVKHILLVDDDFVSKITSDEPDFSDLNSKMKELDKVKNSMTDEQLDSLEDLLKTTANALFKDAGGEESDLNIDFENVDLKSINFEAEGKLVEKFINYGNEKTEEEISVDELIEDLSESTLILPLAVNMDLGGVPLGLKEEVDVAIKKLERERPGVKPETINQLKELFGIETN